MFIKGLIFSLFLVKVTATTVCSFQTPCLCNAGVEKVIDLSSVGLPGKPRFYEVPFEDEHSNSSNLGLYSYNPCYAFDSSDKISTLNIGNVPCKNAAACVRSPGGMGGELPEEHAIGIQSTAKFNYVGDNWHITYTVPGAPQNLTVILKCDNEDTSRLSIEKSETHDNLTVIMTLFTQCACENASKSCFDSTKEEHYYYGLSLGSKLLIAFFTITAAYFLVGIVWNFCNGAQGVELVPNLEFWNDLPKLIIEGVIFTCSCCGRKSSYGEV